MKIPPLAALAAANCLATPAFAEDFSGIRLEGRLGWESHRTTTDYPVEVQVPENPPVTVSGSGTGLSYGLEAGYDAMIGENVLVGVYGGVDLSDVEHCDEAFGDDLGCVATGRNLSAGIRAGVAVAPSVLVYAKGGYSNGRVEYSYDSDVDEEDELDADLAERSRGTDGFHLGGGAELAFSRHFYGKLEYLYTDYGRVGFDGVAADGEPSAAIASRRHQVMAGVGFRF